MTTTLADIYQAHKRLKSYLSPLPTPLEDSPDCGQNVWLKLENVNKTHSFKIRGAINAVLSLDESARAKGIVAASAGNHAQGLAYAARLVGVPAKIVMPTITPQKKIKGTEHYGAEVILHGSIYDEAERYARQLEADDGMTFISPYNDRSVVAGQGTVALEIFDVRPDVGRILVPSSGGGLLAGIGLVGKAINPDCEVIGVQSTATPAMYNFFYGTDLPQQETLAEGLSGDIEKDSITLDICKKAVDQVILVDENSLMKTMRWMIQKHGYIIEASAVVGLAAILDGHIQTDTRLTVVIITGGNVDFDLVQKILA